MASRRLVRRKKRRRDKDYRPEWNQPAKQPVDWGHLVHQVRTHKPGALEVLQDAINVWFPQQFANAKKEANRRAFKEAIYGGKTRHYVGLSASKARARFLPVGRRATGPEAPPFVVRSSRGIKEFGSKGIAFVYSTTGHKSSQGHELPKRLERKALRPQYTGSYKRPKIPVIHWERREPDLDDPDNERDWTEIILAIRGKEGVKWAKEKHDVLGERWDVDSLGNMAFVIFEEYKGWRQDLRKDGYRNKLKFYENGIPR